MIDKRDVAVEWDAQMVVMAIAAIVLALYALLGLLSGSFFGISRVGGETWINRAEGPVAFYLYFIFVCGLLIYTVVTLRQRIKALEAEEQAKRDKAQP